MSEQRKKIILEKLKESSVPLSANYFSDLLGVSRQVIVGDIALLRASGANVIATPRGYILESPPNDNYIIACRHTPEELADEIYTIIDAGCGIMDVVVEHPLYGQITCNLHLFSRNDVEEFLKKMEETKAKPLSHITDDVHIHTIQCPSPEHFQKLEKTLADKGFLVVI
ncbi:MAG: transcription repressor NadR [Eubacteriales bacterium]